MDLIKVQDFYQNVRSKTVIWTRQLFGTLEYTGIWNRVRPISGGRFCNNSLKYEWKTDDMLPVGHTLTLQYFIL